MLPSPLKPEVLLAHISGAVVPLSSLSGQPSPRVGAETPFLPWEVSLDDSFTRLPYPIPRVLVSRDVFHLPFIPLYSIFILNPFTSLPHFHFFGCFLAFLQCS